MIYHIRGGEYGLEDDYSFLSGYKNVKYEDLSGNYCVNDSTKLSEYSVSKQFRSFAYYSIMKVLPTAIQNTWYNDGNYYSTDNRIFTTERFLNEYAVMEALPNITGITDNKENTCLLLVTDITHSPSILSIEDYEPTALTKNEIYGDKSRFVLNDASVKMETEEQISHYNSNMAAWIKVCKWLEYLQNEGVYDNTKIIIASDHGYGLNQFDYMQVTDEFNFQKENALLMIKDFNAHGWQQDNSFMTTADVPTLMFKNIIEKPINPFLGNVITDDEKKEHSQYLTTSGLYKNSEIRKATTMGNNNGVWWSVHDDIFDVNNWKLEKANKK